MGIAAQALAALALATIVYFAFIAGDDSGPLSRIDVDDGIEEATPPERTARKKETTDEQSTRRRAPERSLEPIVPSGTTPGSIQVDTPTGAQYQSSVARLLDRVERGEP